MAVHKYRPSATGNLVGREIVCFQMIIETQNGDLLTSPKGKYVKKIFNALRKNLKTNPGKNKKNLDKKFLKSQKKFP